MTVMKISEGSMLHVPGGSFTMGSERFYPDEAPCRLVKVGAFRIDRNPVTNAEFATFVAETRYRTTAEVPPDPADYPGLDPDLAFAGSLVFHRTDGPVDVRDYSQWWSFVRGASWHCPLGPGSSTEGLENHPVVHVSFADAEAYAAWAGKALPTEAEWEYAARGGLEGADYAWGDELAPGGAMLANYWQGLFPFANQLLDGWERTSPVGTYPANGYGLHDMIGNVWEWTRDWYADRSATADKRKPVRSCCGGADIDPRGGSRAGSFDPNEAAQIPRKVLKGGSHLCAANYCQRYRPAARHAQMVDSSTSHIGFRCIVRD
jgi:formylglycine-generating enzyme